MPTPLRWLTLAILIAISSTPASAQQAPVARTDSIPILTPEQWREDLRSMAEQMEQRHKDLYHTVSREQFAAAVADLHERIPRLERHQIIVGMMRIAAMVGDGHTSVSPLKDAKFGFRSLPLKLYLFEDGLYVRAAVPAHAQLVGARIDSIGGVPVAEALRRVATISPRDNEFTTRFYAPIYLGMPAILHALGLSATPDTAELVVRKGTERWVARVPAGQVDPLWPPDTDISLVTPEGWVDARRTPELPLWLAAPLDYHRMLPIAQDSALYVQLNMVTGIRGQSLAQFAKKIADRVKAMNPRRLILDVRLNRGGYGDSRYPLIRELIKAEDEDTRLFVLVARGAFSATQFILDDLDRFSEAVFIGEPAASKANSYGDAYRNVLPNSGLTVRTSIRWHQVGNDRRPWTPIDVATPYHFADYAAGRDPALEAALRYTPAPSLSERLMAAGRAGGAAAVRAEAQAYLGDVANRYQDLERALTSSGADLYNAGMKTESVELLQLAAERYPRSADVFVVLAQIADFSGQKALARRAAERTLELEPDNRTARSLLERLQ